MTRDQFMQDTRSSIDQRYLQRILASAAVVNAARARMAKEAERKQKPEPKK